MFQNFRDDFVYKEIHRCLTTRNWEVTASGYGNLVGRVDIRGRVLRWHYKAIDNNVQCFIENEDGNSFIGKFHFRDWNIDWTIEYYRVFFLYAMTRSSFLGYRESLRMTRTRFRFFRANLSDTPAGEYWSEHILYANARADRCIVRQSL